MKTIRDNLLKTAIETKIIANAAHNIKCTARTVYFCLSSMVKINIIFLYLGESTSA